MDRWSAAPLVGPCGRHRRPRLHRNTLKANDLVPVEEIMPVSARLIVNQAALKTKRAALQPLIEAFARAAGK